jgi:hypothetical protein
MREKHEGRVNAWIRLLCGVTAVIGTYALCVTPVTAECVTPTQWVEGVKSQSVGVTVATVFDIEQDKAREAMVRLNAMPPRTDISADHILVLMAQDNQTKAMMADAIVGFFNGGCLVARLRDNAAGISAWLNHRGEDA